MGKRWFLVGVMLLLASLLVAGCGIRQEDYDAVVAERDAVQTQVESLQSDLATAQSQTETLQSDLAAAQSEMEGLEGELSKAQGDYDALNEKVARVRVYGEILEKYYFVPPFTITATQLIDISSLIEETGDAEVLEKWTTYLAKSTVKNRDAFWIAVWDGLWESLQ